MLILGEVVISAVLIVLILAQERSAGASGIFGAGGGEGASYQTRRGLEKGIFWATRVAAAVFAGLAVIKLIL